MREVERQLEDLGARVEERAANRGAFPAGLERRVRRRQAATAAATLLAVAALVGASVVGFRWAAERFALRPAATAPVPGPTKASPTQPAITVGEGAGVGPAEISRRPEGRWAPVTEPVYLGGERAFDAVWRLWAWRAERGFVGWHETATADGERLESGGTLLPLTPPCRLTPQIAPLEAAGTSDVRVWLLYGYISPDVASVEISFGGKTFEPQILRVPDSVGSPFDMYGVAVSGMSVEWQNEIALGTVIRDASGQELDRRPLGHCLAL